MKIIVIQFKDYYDLNSNFKKINTFIEFNSDYITDTQETIIDNNFKCKTFDGIYKLIKTC
jgi:hypothetical protein